MHSWWIRGNAVLTLCTSVLAVVCIAATITGEQTHLPLRTVEADDSVTVQHQHCLCPFFTMVLTLVHVGRLPPQKQSIHPRKPRRSARASEGV